MIIIMNEKEKNIYAARAIAEQYKMPDIYFLTSPAIKKDAVECVIIDVDNDSHFGDSSSSPELLAAKLMDLSLPQSIQHIYLIISDLLAKKSLATFAHHLAKQLAKQYQRKLIVHVISDLNFDTTTIERDDEKNIWKIIGNPSQKLIWEGQDILTFMKSPQHCFNGIDYVWDDI